jgi:hypothetical protein
MSGLTSICYIPPWSHGNVPRRVFLMKQLQQRCLQNPITGGSLSPPNPNPLSEMEGDLSEITSAALTAIAPPALPKAALPQTQDHEPEASDDEESDRSSVGDDKFEDDPEEDSDVDSGDEIEETELSGDLHRAMDDFDPEETTLTLNRAEDVEFDMDSVAWRAEDEDGEYDFEPGSDDDNYS